MKLAAARAIAAVIPDDELDPEYIIPSVFNRDVAPAVATAVAEAAERERRRPPASPPRRGVTLVAASAQPRGFEVWALWQVGTEPSTDLR